MKTENNIESQTEMPLHKDKVLRGLGSVMINGESVIPRSGVGTLADIIGSEAARKYFKREKKRREQLRKIGQRLFTDKPKLSMYKK